MNCLIVVDMQRDFVDGALGSPDAAAIVNSVVQRTAWAAEHGERILFTRDTHGEDYLSTQEGQKLPVPHCLRGSAGWEIIDALQPYAQGREIIDKPTFGSRALGERLAELDREEKLEKITFIGLCTDICVISNALLVKGFLPETPLCVEAKCCAGVTPESHETALRAMASCQIEIVR